jgi:hypothetical protein
MQWSMDYQGIQADSQAVIMLSTSFVSRTFAACHY